MTSSSTASVVVAAVFLLACLSPAVHARHLRQTDVSVTAPYTDVQVQAPAESPAPTNVAVTAPDTTVQPATPASSPVPCKAKDGTTVFVNAPYTVVDVSAPGPCPDGAQPVPAPKSTDDQLAPKADVSVVAPYTDVQVSQNGGTTTAVNIPGITSINVATGRKL